MIVRHISKVSLFSILISFFLFPILSFSQSRDAFDVVLSENDKDNVVLVIETSKSVSQESQAKIKDLLGKWDKLNKTPNLPQGVQDYIKKLKDAGLKAKLNATLKNFETFDAGLKNLLDKKAKVDRVIHFYDRYKPDSENPFRSLEVLNNVFEDAETLLPNKVDYEYIRNPTAWLIRTGIGYYKLAIGNALNGLKNIQKQIRDRAGDCIGYIGGDGTADSSDPKRKAFIDINNADVVCYTNLRPNGGKIYANQTGSKVYIWDSKKWTKFACGLGDVNNVFDDWKLANGGVVATSDKIIYLCNQRLREITKARARATMQFNRLSTIPKNSCRYYILEKLGKLRDFQSFMADVDHNQKRFVAKYIFKKDGVRNSAEMFAKMVTENVKFEGYVKDENDKGISYALVSIEAGSQATSVITDKYGHFEVLAKIPEKDHSGLSIRIKATADNYSDFEEKSVLQKQCMNLRLEMKVDGQLIIQPASSTISRGETVNFSVLYIDGDGLSFDVTSSALVSSQFTGYSAGTFPVTATYNNLSISASVEVTKLECKENEIWDATIEGCICKPGYERDEYGECVVIDTSSTIDVLPPVEITIEEINNQLNNADCANVPDAIAKWDPVSEQAICTCIKDYHTWDAGQKKCVPNIQAILANSDCSQWANSEPKWDYGNNQPYCDCISGYVWNDDYNKCLSQQDLLVAQADCSQYLNTQPILDPVNQKVICDCLPGFEWDKNYTKCISKSQSVMQNIDCSMFPNTQPIFDPVSQKAYCDCLPGYEWNAGYTACEKPVQQQVDPSYCSHLPNTRPIFDSVLNNWVCDCMPGFKWNNTQTACKPQRKKPNVDWGNILTTTMGILNAANGNNPLMPPSYGPGTTPPSMQQPVMHQSNCNDQQQAGANAPEVHTIDLGQSYGSFIFDYQTYTAKDQIIIKNGGRVIFNSGCVGENKSVRLNLSGFSPTISVQVNPNCDGGSNTQWNFTVHCPNN